MSASTEKKNRIAQREAGTDKKTIQAQEEAKKKAVSKKRWTWAFIGIAVLVVLVLVLNSTALFTKTTALKIGDRSFSPTEVNFNYASQYNNFMNTYGSYASLFGLNTSSGLAGLKNQECTMTDEENYTWKDYFLDGAIEAMKENVALGRYAEENGIELTDEDRATVDANYEGIEETAKSGGYANGDSLIAANYGKGANLEMAKKIDLASSLAYKAYQAKSEEINAEITDAEVFEQYPTVAVRHILVKAVADEDGTYTDEAKEEAKAKAEDILKEWEDGDATEESFAELAEQYSEDEGSNTNGGLYDDVMEGQMVTEFNDFCFDEARKSGDTAIVYGESGSYAGYHVMYFVGEGDPADNETGRSYILSERLNEWVAELAEKETVEKPFFFRLAGKV
ncbi:MAG: peptidylprolyl isomerase [Eubacteriales bacterium]|nr:peptidylprolyl isomerase [Eubacteriales bacterium]